MSVVGVLISVYQNSPLYPHWGRWLSQSLATVRRLSGAPQIQSKRLPLGFSINLDRDHAIDTKILHSRFEPKSIELISRVVNPGWHCCDVGANIGFLSLLMAVKAGSQGRVVAFEPSTWTYDRLKANVALNSFGWIDCQRAAVGAESQPSIELCVPSGYRLDGTDTSSIQKMPLVALDDFFAKADRLDFLKIDTDGYEPYVLAGALKTIERLRPIIFFEIGPNALKKAGSSVESLVKSISDLRYRFENESGVTIDPVKEGAMLHQDYSLNAVAIPL